MGKFLKLATLLVLLTILHTHTAYRPPGYEIAVFIPDEARDASSAGGLIELRARRGPCECVDDICSCCTGYIMGIFNQKGCASFSYDPDDFAFNVRISMNDRTIYKNSMSGKNPQPICVPIPRFNSIKMCLKFSNVFIVGRNIHACVDMEGMYRNSQLFKMSMDCMRLGANGVALLKPEDGGGLSPGLGGEDDYDVPGEGPDYDVEGVGSAENITETIPTVVATLAPVKVTKKPQKQKLSLIDEIFDL